MIIITDNMKSNILIISEIVWLIGKYCHLRKDKMVNPVGLIHTRQVQ